MAIEVFDPGGESLHPAVQRGRALRQLTGKFAGKGCGRQRARNEEVHGGDCSVLNVIMAAVKIPYEFWIGARYAGMARMAGRKGRRDRFISFIAGSSMASIALGVAALIVVLSVFNGFQRDVRDRMLSVLPHIELYATGRPSGDTLAQWQDLVEAAQKHPSVQAGAPFVAAQAMAVRGRVLRGVQVRGIDPVAEGKVSDLPAQVTSGSLAALTPGSFGVVLGRDLAYALDVRVGDSIMLLAPEGSVSPVGFAPRMRQFKVVGTFNSGHYEYDVSLAFVNAQDAARVFRDNGLAGVRLRIDDMQQAPEVASALTFLLPGGIVPRDWSQNNKVWFAAVQTEKRMMFLVLGLIVLVAAFNLLSSLVMAVKDKQSDIAILRTYGATPAEVGRIFLVQGMLIGAVGTLLGVAGGMAIAYHVDVIVPAIERALGVQFLSRETYFISHLPSDPRAADIVLIGATSFVLSLLATLYPSWRASRLAPAQVLRHD